MCVGIFLRKYYKFDIKNFIIWFDVLVIILWINFLIIIESCRFLFIYISGIGFYKNVFVCKYVWRLCVKSVLIKGNMVWLY